MRCHLPVHLWPCSAVLRVPPQRRTTCIRTAHTCLGHSPASPEIIPDTGSPERVRNSPGLRIQPCAAPRGASSAAQQQSDCNHHAAHITNTNTITNTMTISSSVNCRGVCPPHLGGCAPSTRSAVTRGCILQPLTARGTYVNSALVDCVECWYTHQLSVDIQNCISRVHPLLSQSEDPAACFLRQNTPRHGTCERYGAPAPTSKATPRSCMARRQVRLSSIARGTR